LKRAFLHKGISLIEILVAVTVISVGILILIISYNTYLTFALQNDKHIQAAYLAEEGLEAMTYLRDFGWNKISSLSTTTPYYLTWSPTASYWQTTTTPQTIDGVFVRTISVADVKRDVNKKIATTGTYDPDTKYVTTSIAYKTGAATTTKTMSTYIVNLYNN
jgi:prepilin-type N-terminal cleavage/methylation domain-containing protein